MVIRPDFILSYWVFMWYVAYMLRLTRASPKLLFIIGVLENLWTMWVIWGHATTENFIYFIVVFLLTKVIPLATIWNVPIRKYDLVWSVVLVLVYGLWIFVNKGSMDLSTIQSLKENRNETPGIWLFHRLKSNIMKLI
jgi:hypothetical protein